MVLVLESSRKKQARLGHIMSKKLEAIIDGITKEYNEFAYVTSHDLGAALRAVVGFSDLILQRAQTADNLDDKTLQQLDCRCVAQYFVIYCNCRCIFLESHYSMMGL